MVHKFPEAGMLTTVAKRIQTQPVIPNPVLFPLTALSQLSTKYLSYHKLQLSKVILQYSEQGKNLYFSNSHIYYRPLNSDLHSNFSVKQLSRKLLTPQIT